MKKVFTIIIYFIGCFCLGLLIGKYVGPYIAETGFSENLLTDLLYLFIFAILAFYLQIIIHESGHLVFGLLSGYEFCSFRIKSFMLIKINGKLQFKRFKLFGTGGQCLMIPPSKNDGDFPFLLYNFGGVIFNLLFSAVILLIDFATDGKMAFYNIPFLFLGLSFAVLNGVPIKGGVVSNDGSNALSLIASKEVRKSFWLDLAINAKQTEGVRLKDMPAEWFYMPSDEEMKRSMTASRGVVYCSLLIEQHRFEEAEKEITRLLDLESGIIGLHRNLLVCELIYLRLILDKRFETVSELYTKEQEAFMNAMNKFPSVIRARYTYAVLGERNSRNAEKYKSLFKKISKSYPYKGDLESEFELIQLVDEKAI